MDTNRFKKIKAESLQVHQLKEDLAISDERLKSIIRQQESTNAQLKSANEELRLLYARLVSAEETERKRLSRELHDGTGQMLAGVKFRLEFLSESISSHSKKTRKKILKMEDFLGRAIAEVRRVSQNLMPSELTDLGLQPALRALCREFEERLGFRVAVRFIGVPKRMDPSLALAFFRITQEALNNVAKHAKATRATLSLLCKGNGIKLIVSDNGRGCDERRKRPSKRRGLGLSNIRERIKFAGGSMDFYSKPGKGCRLIIRAPLKGSAG